jgi:hypothetical protein
LLLRLRVGGAEELPASGGGFGLASVRSGLRAGVKKTGGTFTMKKIDIARIPDLKTGVGMHGSVKQKEVAGPVCVGIVIGLMFYL